jgi:hypothetical protein
MGIGWCVGCYKHGECPHSLLQTEMCFAMSIAGFPWHYTTEPERWFE